MIPIHEKLFVDAGNFSDGVYSDPAMVATANRLVPEIKAKFNFRLRIAKSDVYGTMYCIKPKDTILIAGKLTLNKLVHETGHHAFHRCLTKDERNKVKDICKNRKHVDPNEQFATTVEWLVTGKAQRFERGQQADLSLVKERSLLTLVKMYFLI